MRLDDASAACPCCLRRFTTAAEVDTTVANLRDVAAATDASKNMQRFRTLRAMLSVYEDAAADVASFHTEVARAASLRSAMDTHAAEAAAAAVEQRASRARLDTLRATLALAREVAGDVARAGELHRDAANTGAEADQLEARLRQHAPLPSVTAADGAAITTAEACDRELTAAMAALRGAQDDLAGLQRREADAARQVAGAAEEAAAAAAEMARHDALLDAASRTATAAQDAGDAARAAESTREVAEAAARTAGEEAAAARSALEGARKEAAAVAGPLAERLSAVEAAASRLADARGRILRALADAGLSAMPAHLDAGDGGEGGGGGVGGGSDSAYADMRSREVVLHSTMERLEAELAAARGEHTRAAATRSVAALVRRIEVLGGKAREAAEAAARVKAEVDAVTTAPSGEVLDPDALLVELRERRHAASLRKAVCDGRIAELRDAADVARRELAKDAMRTAEKRATDLLIACHTLTLAVADLDRYYKALDAALMHFHQLKVAEINGIIRELWGRTYQGDDIDTIEIRSDLDDPPADGAGVLKARSYNYRVVMMKGDAELGMRGRCSAGQKVLASIVIRLALAESFCVHTGILALDEPTTNLVRDGRAGGRAGVGTSRTRRHSTSLPTTLQDAPNRKGLARALGRLIEARKDAGNLQLIVITHDDEFVAELGRSLVEGGGGSSSKTQMGTYYRVYREEVRPGVYRSRIERQAYE